MLIKSLVLLFAASACIVSADPSPQTCRKGCPGPNRGSESDKLDEDLKLIGTFIISFNRDYAAAKPDFDKANSIAKDAVFKVAAAAKAASDATTKVKAINKSAAKAAVTAAYVALNAARVSVAAENKAANDALPAADDLVHDANIFNIRMSDIKTRAQKNFVQKKLTDVDMTFVNGNATLVDNSVKIATDIQNILRKQAESEADKDLLDSIKLTIDTANGKLLPSFKVTPI